MLLVLDRTRFDEAIEQNPDVRAYLQDLAAQRSLETEELMNLQVVSGIVDTDDLVML